MIVTDHFVYIHVSRSAGTFLNKLIMRQMPGARMIQYHGHLEDLPEEYAHLPVIGFVRNPFDWYVSMFADYQRKRQYVYQVLSERGQHGFEETVSRFANLGDGSERSQHLLTRLTKVAPQQINTQRPPPRHLPGLTSAHFASYPEGPGYYSWLFDLMFRSERDHDIRIGRFENLREDALRLIEETGAPVTDRMRAYIAQSEPLNASSRPRSFADKYSSELEQIITQRHSDILDRFDYKLAGD